MTQTRRRPRWSAASRCGWPAFPHAARSRPGQPVELGVDTRNLQFFDPATGLSIGHPKATAALAE